MTILEAIRRELDEPDATARTLVQLHGISYIADLAQRFGADHDIEEDYRQAEEETLRENTLEAALSNGWTPDGTGGYDYDPRTGEPSAHATDTGIIGLYHDRMENEAMEDHGDDIIDETVSPILAREAAL